LLFDHNYDAVIAIKIRLICCQVSIVDWLPCFYESREGSAWPYPEPPMEGERARRSILRSFSRNNVKIVVLEEKQSA